MPKSQYQIDLPVFAGPLDLLLHLIERNEMDITAISLVQITEQYRAQVEQMQQERIEELMDFLVIGARLVLIKSRALLPQTPVLVEGEEEEDPAEALVRQLQQYRRFKLAAADLHQRELKGYSSGLLAGGRGNSPLTLSPSSPIFSSASARAFRNRRFS